MLSVIAAFAVGFMIRRLWPTGAIFVVIWPAVSLAVSLGYLAWYRSSVGGRLQAGLPVITMAYLKSLAVVTAVFLIGFGIRQLLARAGYFKSTRVDSNA